MFHVDSNRVNDSVMVFYNRYSISLVTYYYYYLLYMKYTSNFLQNHLKPIQFSYKINTETRFTQILKQKMVNFYL